MQDPALVGQPILAAAVFQAAFSSLRARPAKGAVSGFSPLWLTAFASRIFTKNSTPAQHRTASESESDVTLPVADVRLLTRAVPWAAVYAVGVFSILSLPQSQRFLVSATPTTEES